MMEEPIRVDIVIDNYNYGGFVTAAVESHSLRRTGTLTSSSSTTARPTSHAIC